MDETEGHGILSKLCSYELDEIKRNGIICEEFRDTAKYALLYGVQHMLHLQGDAGLCGVAIKKLCGRLKSLCLQSCVYPMKQHLKIFYGFKSRTYVECLNVPVTKLHALQHI